MSGEAAVAAADRMSGEAAVAAAGPTLSAIVPVYNGRAFLARSLPPLLAAVGRDLVEVIVVDDGSTDGSGEWAEQQGARRLATAGRGGPGLARNQGARAARGEALLFVDADVVIHPDAPARARAALAEPGVVAVFGSYDDAPPDPGFASQYMNLRHHYTHHAHAGEASTFWAGCGAIRRDAFLRVGGFDAARYARPSIEDIELGYRLRADGGRIRLVPELQGTHLKVWTLGGVIHTDIFCRALPWGRLLVAAPASAAVLNTTGGERGKALLAAAVLLSALGALLGLLPWPLPLALFALAVLASRGLFQVYRRRRGWPFALAALAFHQLHYCYAAATYAWCWLEHRIGLAPQAGEGAA